MASPLCFPQTSTAGSRVGSMGVLYGIHPENSFKKLQEFPFTATEHYWCLLESDGRWLEQAGPNLQQFRTSQGIPVNNSFFKLGKIWSQYPNFSWSVSRMRNHTEHFSNFLKGHPPLGIFIWINKMKRNLYYSFPFSPHTSIVPPREQVTAFNCSYQLSSSRTADWKSDVISSSLLHWRKWITVNN